MGLDEFVVAEYEDRITEPLFVELMTKTLTTNKDVVEYIFDRLEGLDLSDPANFTRILRIIGEIYV